jgi:hypothetical protein
MPRDKVTFPLNIPTQVILDSAGELQPTKNGDDEYRYFLRANRIMWVPPTVHDQILASGASEGDALVIEKSKPGKAAATWIVGTTQDERANGYSTMPSRIDTPPTPPAAPRPQRELHSPEHARYADAQRAAAQAAAYPPPILPTSGSCRHCGATPTTPGQYGAAQLCKACAPQPAARLAADAAELPTGPADRMAACLRDAIELWRGVRQMEPELRYDSGDVRALAATLFIGGGK